MKTGLSLVELAKRIEANRELKHDVIATPGNGTAMVVDADGTTKLQIVNRDHSLSTFPVRPIAHDQIASRVEIPSKYYDRMLREKPHLLANNVNTWFEQKPEKRLIRTLGGDVRAFLSNRYQRIENEEIAEVALPILMNLPGVEVVSCEVTERRLYIQATTARVRGEVKVGDVVQAGVIIKNSEVGHGSVSVEPMIYRLACLNGMILPDNRYRANHTGRRIDANEDLWKDDTRKADDKAILLKVRDMVAASVDAVFFQKNLRKLQDSTGQKLEGDPTKAVEVLAKKLAVTDTEKGGILRSLIEGGDLSRWGVANAVTHQAHTLPSYDRAVEFEQLGAKVIDLPAGEWREVAEAA